MFQGSVFGVVRTRGHDQFHHLRPSAASLQRYGPLPFKISSVRNASVRERMREPQLRCLPHIWRVLCVRHGTQTLLRERDISADSTLQTSKPWQQQCGFLQEKNAQDVQEICAESVPKYEVFLGGSCNPTTWRTDTAIPVLKRLGITYYNPQVSHWGPELVELEWAAKQQATVLFFVMDNETRSVASLIEAAHSAARQRKLILVIHPYQGPGQELGGETLSQQEFDDLSAGQMVLQDLVERQGIPVFDDIPVALNCTAKVLRDNLSVQDLSLKDFAQPVKMAHVQLGDKLIKLRETFDALDHNNSGQLNLADVCMAFRILTSRNLSMSDLRNIVASQRGLLGKDINDVPLEQQSVTFEQFCAIVAEFRMRESEIERGGGGGAVVRPRRESGLWDWVASLACTSANLLSESMAGFLGTFLLSVACC
ncbi:hypothetical protein B566_EDAN008542 [Ephemera danica]|nr:hypothetical protein B566_EDAN008542 [Ephemera danica]